MTPAPRIPRRLAGLTALAALAVAGCTASPREAAPEPVPLTIALIRPLAGPYKTLAEELPKGWQIYLDLHGGKLGGRRVEAVTVDEGIDRDSGVAAVRQLLEARNVVAAIGVANADVVEPISQLLTEHQVPLIGSGGRPSNLTDLSYVWHTSWQSREPGQAIADHLRTAVAGPVYAIGPDYIGGYDNIGGFVDPFLAAGGQLANQGGKPTWTPWPTTTNFMPYLNQIAETGAKAVYCFYAGTAGIDFLKQYEAAGLKGRIPLYGAGFLTEGPVLAAEGAAADGVRTVMNYAPNLDNAANRAFAPAYQTAYLSAPNLYAVTSYDSALILDQAIAAAGANPTGATVNAAISALGSIDSPRGQWRFGRDHSPIQPWYLREVQTDGRARANVVVQNLTVTPST